MSSKKELYEGYRPYYPEGPGSESPVEEILFMPSTIETIDFALHDWLNEIINIHCTTNEGWKKVPLIWSMPERARQVKDNKDLRSQDIFTLPAISIERNSLVKDPSFKGVAWSHIPRTPDARGGAITAARIIQQEKTSNFANANSERTFGQQTNPAAKSKTVFKTMTMPIPTYVVAKYKLTINTEYQQQMNEIFNPFITHTGQINNFFIRRDGHKFEGFIENDFSLENNISNLQQEERNFKTIINLKILGYLIGSGANDNQPKISIREGAAEFRITRERTVFGDKKDFK